LFKNYLIVALACIILFAFRNLILLRGNVRLRGLYVTMVFDHKLVLNNN